MKEIERLAALAMLKLSEAEAPQFARDIPEIFRLTDVLRGEVMEDTLSHAVRMEMLREDAVRNPPDGARALISLSKKERDGFVCVARTVG